MKRVLTAVILIPLVVLALFRAPLWLFTLLVLGVALLAAEGVSGHRSGTAFNPFRALGYLFVLCLFVTCGVVCQRRPIVSDWRPRPCRGHGFIGVILSSPFVLLVASLRREPLTDALGDAAVSFLLLPYIGFTCLHGYSARHDNGAIFMLFVMLIVWAGDIAAFYVGRAIGKHKLAPRVSPGKSWEGSVASVGAAVVVGLLLFRFLLPIYKGLVQLRLLSPDPSSGIPEGDLLPSGWWLLFAVCVNVAAQLGDLVESALKRGAGVKDSGSLLPGHGGVLDRIDALLFAYR